MDTEPIIRLAKDLADLIEESIEARSADGFVRQVMVCVEVDLGASTTIFSVSADDRPWVQMAFLDRCAQHLEAQQAAVNLEDD